jgi:putrescine transport system permease protein
MKTFLEKHFGKFWLLIVFGFLYLPLAFMVLFSFNSTRQDARFTGFSLRWYEALLNDSKIVDGFFLSLKIAAITGLLSAVLATFSAFVLVRYRRFLGRTVFSGMGHTLLGMAYGMVVIQSRLMEMDRSIEQAAMDLGARPHQVFFLVTLPNIFQAILAAFLLAFTLSFDDVVITEFLSGPGVSTLPQVIFGYARRGINPTIYAAATILIVTVTIVVISYAVWVARQTRRREREMAAAVRG